MLNQAATLKKDIYTTFIIDPNEIISHVTINNNSLRDTMDNRIHLMQLNQDGSASEISVDALAATTELVWIHVDLSAVKSLLKKIISLPHLVEEVLSNKSARPRTIIYNDTLLATLRGVNLTKGDVPENMISIRLWIQHNRIITVHRRNLAAITEIKSALQRGAGPKTAAEFLEMLLYAIADKSTDVVTSLADNLDSIEDKLTGKLDQNNREELSEMRRRIILLRRFLIPQREAIARISVDKITWLTDINMTHLREIVETNTRILEDLNAERERSIVIQEELFARSQEAINQKMLLVAILSVIFMPLSFVTGLLGINVGGIPGEAMHYGFMIVCVLLVMIFCVQLFYLKKKNWI